MYDASNAVYDSSAYKFTGKERDPESNLDYFGARYYRSTMGRWMTPDPLASSADLTNPQSWNRYSYVENKPLVFVDPDGQQKVSIATYTKVTNRQAGNPLTLPSPARSNVRSTRATAKTPPSVYAVKDEGDGVDISSTIPYRQQFDQEQISVEFDYSLVVGEGGMFLQVKASISFDSNPNMASISTADPTTRRPAGDVVEYDFTNITINPKAFEGLGDAQLAALVKSAAAGNRLDPRYQAILRAATEEQRRRKAAKDAKASAAQTKAKKKSK